MRRLIMWNMVTLDGCFQGPEPWSIDWLEYTWGPELEAFSMEQLDAAGRLLFGRVTYEGMAAHWTGETGRIADRMNRLPKTVFSRTLTRADWSNTDLVSSDAAVEVRRLKEEAGDDMFIFGSATLCDGLMAQGLIDEFRIGVNPVLLAEGTPLFRPRSSRLRLELIETRPLDSGCVILRYRSGPGS